MVKDDVKEGSVSQNYTAPCGETYIIFPHRLWVDGAIRLRGLA